MRYEDRRHPDLPWGHWLHYRGTGLNVLVDEAGREWRSVRECFLIDRLGLMPEPGFSNDVDLERMLAFLAAISRRVVPIAEQARDLFGGELEFYRHYQRWLRGLGLLYTGVEATRWRPLTVEGNAVLLMLAATRSPKLAHIPLGSEALQIFSSDMADPEREQWFGEVDQFARTKLHQRFERTEIWHNPAIALTGLDIEAAMPLKRTYWSQRFLDEASRDAFYAWLCLRTDRWGIWADKAHMHGAAAFTAHLLELVALEIPKGGRTGTTVSAPPEVIALPDLSAAPAYHRPQAA